MAWAISIGTKEVLLEIPACLGGACYSFYNPMDVWSPSYLIRRKLMTTKETLIQKLKSKEARVGILGLGYVGLPLAVVFAEAGFKVTGIDPDSRKVDSLKKGISYIPDVETEAVEALVKS